MRAAESSSFGRVIANPLPSGRNGKEGRWGRRSRRGALRCGIGERTCEDAAARGSIEKSFTRGLGRARVQAKD